MKVKRPKCPNCSNVMNTMYIREGSHRLNVGYLCRSCKGFRFVAFVAHKVGPLFVGLKKVERES